MYYSINKTTKPGGDELQVRFSHAGKLTADETLNRVAERTRMSRGDVIRVLYGLQEVLREELQNGKIVEVEPLGNFRLSIHSKALKPGESFNRKNIKNISYLFHPHKNLRINPDKLRFHPVNSPLARNWPGPICDSDSVP